MVTKRIKKTKKVKSKVKSKVKISKEMRELIRAINNWSVKHDGDVSFIASFVAFDKDSEVIDDRLFCYGIKNVLREQIYDMAEEVVNNKEEFVNV